MEPGPVLQSDYGESEPACARGVRWRTYAESQDLVRHPGRAGLGFRKASCLGEAPLNEIPSIITSKV